MTESPDSRDIPGVSETQSLIESARSRALLSIIPVIYQGVRVKDQRIIKELQDIRPISSHEITKLLALSLMRAVLPFDSQYAKAKITDTSRFEQALAEAHPITNGITIDTHAVATGSFLHDNISNFADIRDAWFNDFTQAALVQSLQISRENGEVDESTKEMTADHAVAFVETFLKRMSQPSMDFDKTTTDLVEQLFIAHQQLGNSGKVAEVLTPDILPTLIAFQVVIALNQQVFGQLAEAVIHLAKHKHNYQPGGKLDDAVTRIEQLIAGIQKIGYGNPKDLTFLNDPTPIRYPLNPNQLERRKLLGYLPELGIQTTNITVATNEYARNLGQLAQRLK